MTPKAVASIFRVTPREVRRWAKAGVFTKVKTEAGHSCYLRSEIEAYINDQLGAA